MNNNAFDMGNKVCHGFWCVWRQGKDISYFGLIYSCGKIDLILEDIPFVSICSYMLVISKDLQTGCAISGLNSYLYLQISFKYVYLWEPKVGVMPRLQSPKLLRLKRSFHIHVRCLRCWYGKEISTGSRVGFSCINSTQYSSKIIQLITCRCVF